MLLYGEESDGPWDQRVLDAPEYVNGRFPGDVLAEQIMTVWGDGVVADNSDNNHLVLTVVFIT